MRRLLAFAATALSSGCLLTGHADPFGAGATGTITLGAAADAGTFDTVEVRACPASAGDAPLCTASASEPIDSVSLPASMGFPLTYTANRGRGLTSKTADWKVVVWLSRGTAGAMPKPGEWWGTSAFKLPQFDQDHFSGQAVVDVTVDRQQP